MANKLKKEYTSPKKVDAYVEKILDKLNAKYDPEIIPVRPIENSIRQDCFGNVEKKISTSGGQKHYGWAVWKSGILYEAEFHAVWESNDGELIDVTSHEPPCKEVMFISDDGYPYTGQHVDNCRINSTQNPLVDDFIMICEYIQYIQVLYSLGNRVDDFHLQMPKEIGGLIMELDCLKSGLLQFIYKRGKKEKSCFCGRNIKYSKCHGKNLKHKLKSHLKKAKEFI